MQQRSLLLLFVLLLGIFSACEDETALEKAKPWDVSGISPKTYRAQRPGYAGYEYQVYVVEPGTGPLIQHGQYVCYRFNAFLLDGTAFQTTIDADPYCYTVDTNSFPIAGLEEGILLMRKGSKYRFVFPSQLAFGSNYSFNGVVPPNSTVMFDVEIQSVSY